LRTPLTVPSMVAGWDKKHLELTGRCRGAFKTSRRSESQGRSGGGVLNTSHTCDRDHAVVQCSESFSYLPVRFELFRHFDSIMALVGRP
jgi:hypothetical protein